MFKIDRRKLLISALLIPVAIGVRPFYSFASDMGPLSEEVKSQIISDGGKVIWDDLGSQVFYQSEKNEETDGPIKDVIVSNLGSNDFFYSSGGRGRDSGRWYIITTKSNDPSFISPEIIDDIYSKGGDVEFSQNNFASLYQSKQRELINGPLTELVEENFGSDNYKIKIIGDGNPPQGTRIYIGKKY